MEQAGEGLLTWIREVPPSCGGARSWGIPVVPAPAGPTCCTVLPETADWRLVGLANGSLFLTLSGGSPPAEVTGAIPHGFVARIVIDPTDPAVAYVTLDAYAGQQVWKTTDLTSGHPTWQTGRAARKLTHPTLGN
jgi:hypothetical protein